MDAGLSAYGMLTAMLKCWRVTMARFSACCSYLMAACYPVQMTRPSKSGRAHAASGRSLATTIQSGATLPFVYNMVGCQVPHVRHSLGNPDFPCDWPCARILDMWVPAGA